jgi:RND family efflux transporter MFP subunit
MSKVLRCALRLIVLGAILFGFYFFGSAYLWPPPDTDTIHAVGIIEAPEVNITSRIAGRISQLDIQEGDPVRKGQVICQIEDVDLRNQLQHAEADLQRAKVDLADADKNLARSRSLKSQGVISVKDFDDATTRVAEFQSAVSGATTNIQFYKDQLRDTQILAPIDGVVVNKALEVGEWVTPGTPVITVDDLSTMWARVDVQETDLAAIHVGQAAQVFLPGKPPTAFSGRVMAIGQEGQFATERDVQRGRQDIRTFYVKIRVLQAGDSLKPGMTAQVALSRRDAIANGSNTIGSSD